MSNILDHWKTADSLSRTASSSGSNFKKENIWFQWGDKDDHVIRLVGDFKIARSHWIGDSQFGKDISILEKTAFKGDGKLMQSVACGNWDPETESPDPEGNCPVCRLGRNADQFLRENGKELSEVEKETLKTIRRKCSAKEVFLFKCIDRDNPWLDDEKTVKGYKIIKMNKDLANAIIELSRQMDGVNIVSPEGGCDITISRKRQTTGGASVKYSALPVLKGGSCKITPLTDEERAYRDLDLSKFCGKPVDVKRFEEELTSENNVKEIYNLSEMSDIKDDDSAPF